MTKDAGEPRPAARARAHLRLCPPSEAMSAAQVADAPPDRPEHLSGHEYRVIWSLVQDGKLLPDAASDRWAGTGEPARSRAPWRRLVVAAGAMAGLGMWTTLR